MFDLNKFTLLELKAIRAAAVPEVYRAVSSRDKDATSDLDPLDLMEFTAICHATMQKRTNPEWTIEQSLGYTAEELLELMGFQGDDEDDPK